MKQTQRVIVVTLKETVTETHDFITESVIELEQFGPHGWYIRLFESHKNFL